MEPVQEKKVTGRLSALLSLIGFEEPKSKIVLSLQLLFVLASAVLSFLLLPPLNFPKDKIVTIERGASLSTVSEILYHENIIRSQTLFEFCAKTIGGKKPILAGDYLFKEPVSVCTVASRIAHGVSGISQIRVTIPEGMSNNEIAVVFAKTLPNFDRNTFFETLNKDEGFLFPDTYYFPVNATVPVIGELMSANFDRKIKPLQGEISASGHSLRDIVIMASILEREAMTDADRKLVSGILWARISKGMPLQADATLKYLLGKTSKELTADDLQFKSAYNTYTNRGLPSGPIGNPGIEAILAAIHPTLSPYLYYLSDDQGVMHYAKTFAEHKANKVKYLGNN